MSKANNEVHAKVEVLVEMGDKYTVERVGNVARMYALDGKPSMVKDYSYPYEQHELPYPIERLGATYNHAEKYEITLDMRHDMLGNFEHDLYMTGVLKYLVTTMNE